MYYICTDFGEFRPFGMPLVLCICSTGISIVKSYKKIIRTIMKRFLGAKFTSTLSIALVLSVLGLMIMGGLVSADMARQVREQFTVTITVSDAASSDYGERLVKRLEKAKYTASAVYVSPDSAMKVLMAELGDEHRDFLDYNPLPPTVELRLKAEYAETDSIDAIIKELEQSQRGNIASTDYKEGLLDKVNNNMQRLAIGLTILAAIFLIICISLISNTVRLIMHADRFLINTMRLVGATKWFVRRPFIRTHVICGLIASIIALVGLAALVYGTCGQTNEILRVLMQPTHLVILVSAIVVLGILIPALAAWYATDRYMGKTVDELYLM